MEIVTWKQSSHLSGLVEYLYYFENYSKGYSSFVFMDLNKCGILRTQSQCENSVECSTLLTEIFSRN